MAPNCSMQIWPVSIRKLGKCSTRISRTLTLVVSSPSCWNFLSARSPELVHRLLRGTPGSRAHLIYFPRTDEKARFLILVAVLHRFLTSGRPKSLGCSISTRNIVASGSAMIYIFVDRFRIEPRIRSKIEPRIRFKIEPGIRSRIEPRIRFKIEPGIRSRIEPRIRFKAQRAVVKLL